MQKRLKLIYLFLACALCFVILAGCATTGTRAIPAYNINGTSYISLATLASAEGFNLKFDTFARTIQMDKGTHRITLMLNDRTVLVDGESRNLSGPVQIYKSTIVVPGSFRGQIVDPLFPVAASERAPVYVSKIKKVVIDPGHGGRDPGAIGRSSGVREKDITLDIALRLGRILRSQGIEVILTRASDTTVSLAYRVDKAHGTGADIYISIHANANRVRSLDGFEVYYIAENAGDNQRARLSAKEVKPDFDADCFAGSSYDLKTVLWEMVYTANRAESIELAQAICRSIDRNLDVSVFRIKGARYYVLKGVRMPGVLVEVGYLSNPKEERLLRNSSYRQQLAEGIARGLNDYAREFSLAEAN